MPAITSLPIQCSGCPIIQTLNEIGSEWHLVVFHDLRDGELRFNELQRSTTANARTLSRVLGDLTERGFVYRRVDVATDSPGPIATYYGLTDKGRSLSSVFNEIEGWADEWLSREES